MNMLADGLGAELSADPVVGVTTDAPVASAAGNSSPAAGQPATPSSAPRVASAAPVVKLRSSAPVASAAPLPASAYSAPAPVMSQSDVKSSGAAVKVCVKFLPITYGEKELTDLVAKFGQISNPKIVRVRTTPPLFSLPTSHFPLPVDY